MNDDNSSAYRGCSITTRCREVELLMDGADLRSLHSPWAKRFTASFTVEPSDEGDSSWQQFPKATFYSAEKAKGNALAIAKGTIDLKLAEV